MVTAVGSPNAIAANCIPCRLCPGGITQRIIANGGIPLGRGGKGIRFTAASGRSAGKVDTLQVTAIAKGLSTNGTHTRANDHSLQIGHLECLCANTFYGIGDHQFGQTHTIERTIYNCGNCAGNVHGGKGRAATKGLFADGSNTLGQGGRHQFTATLKGLATQTGHTVFHDQRQDVITVVIPGRIFLIHEIIIVNGAATADSQHTACAQRPVDTGAASAAGNTAKGANIVSTKDMVAQFGAIHTVTLIAAGAGICGVAHCLAVALNCGRCPVTCRFGTGVMDVCCTGSVLAVRPLGCCSAIIDIFNAGTAAKGIRVNLYACIKIDAGQITALIKCILIDFINVFRNRDTGQTTAVLERTMQDLATGYGNRLKRCRNIVCFGDKGSTIGACIGSLFGFNTTGVATGTKNITKGILVGINGSSHTCANKGQCDGFQAATAAECTSAHSCNTIRDCDAGNTCTVCKGVIANGVYIARNGKAGDSSAIVESRSANACDTIRNIDAGQAAAVTKCIIANAGNLFRNCDAFQFAATAKHFRTNGFDACGDIETG